MLRSSRLPKFAVLISYVHSHGFKQALVAKSCEGDGITECSSTVLMSVTVLTIARPLSMH